MTEGEILLLSIVTYIRNPNVSNFELFRGKGGRSETRSPTILKFPLPNINICKKLLDIFKKTSVTEFINGLIRVKFNLHKLNIIRKTQSLLTN
jgi:hypothetical protein